MAEETSADSTRHQLPDTLNTKRGVEFRQCGNKVLKDKVTRTQSFAPHVYSACVYFLGKRYARPLGSSNVPTLGLPQSQRGNIAVPAWD